MYLAGCDVSGAGRDGAGIMNAITANGETCAKRLHFLRSYGAYKVSIGDGTVSGDLVVSNELDCVGAFDTATDTLVSLPNSFAAERCQSCLYLGWRMRSRYSSACPVS